MVARQLGAMAHWGLLEYEFQKKDDAPQAKGKQERVQNIMDMFDILPDHCLNVTHLGLQEQGAGQHMECCR